MKVEITITKPSGKKITEKLVIKGASDQYHAGDLAQEEMQRRHGNFFYPVIKFGQPRKLAADSRSLKLALAAGPEEM